MTANRKAPALQLCECSSPLFIDPAGRAETLTSFCDIYHGKMSAQVTLNSQVRFADYFVICGLDLNTGLEINVISGVYVFLVVPFSGIYVSFYFGPVMRFMQHLLHVDVRVMLSLRPLCYHMVNLCIIDLPLAQYSGTFIYWDQI